MLAVLSPAKTLDFSRPRGLTKRSSLPRFGEDADALARRLARLSRPKLAALMDLSPSLAELNSERFRDWQPTGEPSAYARSKQAILAFKGDVYQAFRLDKFSDRDFLFAQQRVRILSGIYGLLRPLDLIQPYRLEMGTRFKTNRGADLYAFWGTRITDLLKDDLAESGSDVLINLASEEYFRAVRADCLPGRVIAPVFLDEKNGALKIISFFAKSARGAMANWIIRQRVTNPDDLHAFDALGYRIDRSASSPDRPVFFREESVRAAS